VHLRLLSAQPGREACLATGSTNGAGCATRTGPALLPVNHRLMGEIAMNKIKLNLDRLSVDSFETATPEEIARGTVHGHYSQVGTCDGRVGTCQYGGTCGAGCASRKNCTTIECV
jgi:hypothetical protein